MNRLLIFLACSFVVAVTHFMGQEVGRYSVVELNLAGETYTANESPVRDVVLESRWLHENGTTTKVVYGFFDGDGRGGAAGDVFKIRFCPTLAGEWKLEKTLSNDLRLNGQKEGLVVHCVESEHPGFWEVQPGNRWYARSDGSRPYIVGNTLYSFLSEYRKGEPTGGSIEQDVSETARYFKKIRFGITGDLFPHPTEKPFLDDVGNPSDDGNYCHRPNPRWFGERIDLAVRTAHRFDMIADIIFNGPDDPNGRSVLSAEANGGDLEPFLRYMAARYGSYPNVWMCLSNEYDIREPRYDAARVIEAGKTIRDYLPYPTPLSVHGDQGNWKVELNTDPSWNDHVIIQNKIKNLSGSADYNALNFWIGGKKPVINDELAYEGKGDGWTEADVIEAMLGAFVGGGYASTGFKQASKEGHYFSGNFSASEHESADNLKWMREVIDRNIGYWKMEPTYATEATYGKYRRYRGSRSSIFYNLDLGFRVLECKDEEYVVASNVARKGVMARLPEGRWNLVAYDCIRKMEMAIGDGVEGEFTFDIPDSRALLLHVRKIRENNE